MSKRRRSDHQPSVLMLVEGEIGPRMMGPAIRGWELATVLAQRHRVTVAARGGAAPPGSPVRVVTASYTSLFAEALRHDVFIAPWVPPFLLPVLSAAGKRVITDQFDPVELELDDTIDPLERRALRALNRLQLCYADAVTCGGERQRDELLRELRELGRHDAEVRVVRFGLGEAPSRDLRERRVIRNRLPQPDGTEDVVAVWWGSVWTWFDADTVIAAFARVCESRPWLRLVFIGQPATRDPATDRNAEARDAAARSGLLDRQIFFLGWVPYTDRAAYLADADFAVVLHRESREAHMAARVRYLDLLWAGLPSILGAGDETGEAMGAAGAAALVAPGDVDAAAAAIARYADDPAERSRAASAARAMAASYAWSGVAAPLIELVDDDTRRGAGRRRAGRLFRDVVAFYGVRLRIAAAKRARGARR